MNPALRDVWKTRSRYKVLAGGRASSKSTDIAIHLIRLSRRMSLRILCARQFQNSISQSVYALIKDYIWKLGLQDEYQFTLTKIIHLHTKSSFTFLGINRNIDEIKSMEAIDMVWIEEAHAITKEQWEIIDPTIRAEHSEIIISFNPQHRQDFSFQRFIEKPPTDTVVRQINYDENPFLSETIKRVIANAKEEDEEEFKHIYLGQPREGDDRSLFAYSDIDRAMDNDMSGVDTSGVYSLGCDVARYGRDSSVISIREGHKIHLLQTFKGYDTMEFSTQIDRIASRGKTPDAVFIDSIGVGAGVVDKTRQMGISHVVDANVSMKPQDTKVYQNKRAEMYFNLKKFVETGGKLPDDKELKEELLALRYFYNETSGKIQLIKKDDLKEELGRSPDKSDSVALHFFRSVRPMALRYHGGANGTSNEWSVYD